MKRKGKYKKRRKFGNDIVNKSLPPDSKFQMTGCNDVAELSTGQEGRCGGKAQDGAKDTGLPLSEEGLRRSSRKRLHQLQALLESLSGSQAPQNCQQVDKKYEISDSAGDTRCPLHGMNTRLGPCLIWEHGVSGGPNVLQDEGSADRSWWAVGFVGCPR